MYQLHTRVRVCEENGKKKQDKKKKSRAWRTFASQNSTSRYVGSRIRELTVLNALNGRLAAAACNSRHNGIQFSQSWARMAVDKEQLWFRSRQFRSSIRLLGQRKKANGSLDKYTRLQPLFLRFSSSGATGEPLIRESS